MADWKISSKNGYKNTSYNWKDKRPKRNSSVRGYKNDFWNKSFYFKGRKGKEEKGYVQKAPAFSMDMGKMSTMTILEKKNASKKWKKSNQFLWFRSHQWS